ncbi:MAG: hypothetical protein ABIJ09_23540 [Pseudomonadota bacterium]
MLRSKIGLSAVLALTGLVGGCPFDLTGLLDAGTGCEGDFAVTVGSGITPEISWDGDAAGLAVTKFPETTERQWTLSMSGSPFPSPVTYGTVPTGALEAEGVAKTLEVGTEYAVTITAGDGNKASCQTFTP